MTRPYKCTTRMAENIKLQPSKRHSHTGEQLTMTRPETGQPQWQKMYNDTAEMADKGTITRP